MARTEGARPGEGSQARELRVLPSACPALGFEQEAAGCASSTPQGLPLLHVHAPARAVPAAPACLGPGQHPAAILGAARWHRAARSLGTGAGSGAAQSSPSTSPSLSPPGGVPGGLSGSHTVPEPQLLGARLPVPDLGPVFHFAATSWALVTAVLAAWHCRDSGAGPGALSTRREAPPAPCHLPREREVPGWLLWHRPPPGRALLPPCCAG